MPAYPPKDYDYLPRLNELKLEAVAYDQFTKLKKEESKSLSKTLVHEVEHYPGMFRDAEGKVYDLRPNDS